MWVLAIFISVAAISFVRLEIRALPGSVEGALRAYRDDYQLTLVSIENHGKGWTVGFLAFPKTLRMPMWLIILVNERGYVETRERVQEFLALVAVYASGPLPPASLD